MIPTTVSSSPSTATPSISGNGNGNGSGGGSSNGHSNGQQNASSVVIGIASLILEGRAVTEEDLQTSQAAPRANAVGSGDIITHATAAGGGGGVAGVSSISSGRQSPKPSTSRAAMSVASGGHMMNITTNPHAFGFATSPLLFIDPHQSSSASSSSAESTHQRWTQKLCQLRQASPAASLSHAYEQKVAVEAHSTTGEPELVALAINESGSERGDFEIVRRSVFSHRPSISNAAPGSTSPSASLTSDNFLHSLQSLATTCLRGGSPSAESSYRYSALASPQLVSPTIAATSPNSSYRATTPRLYNPYSMDLPGSGSSSGSGIQSPKSLWSPASNSDAAMASCNAREKLLRQSTRRIPIPSTVVNSSNMAASSCSGSSITCTQKSTPRGASASSPKQPQRGPHCDQFLKKMGLLQSQNVDVEDHICDMSYVNITCSRWRAYCLKIEAIVARGEPICIEVYLGPVGHKVLLEQWIITQKEKVPPPTMTLPSLCSAIRSQLYFSQISAWCDVITKGDTATYDSGRIIFPATTGAAGDLATSAMASSSACATASVTPGSSPSPTSSPLNQTTSVGQSQRPRLNIFYRIKPFDSTACFNSMPNVHNFPNVNVSENFSISVCLKSLPRLAGGIPRIAIAMLSSATSGDGAGNETTASNHGMEGVSCEAYDRRTVTTPPSATGIISPAETPRTSRQSTQSAMASCKYAKSVRTHTSRAAAPQAGAVSERESMDASNGMHRCTFFIGEDELAVDEADGGDEEDNASDFANGAGESSNSSSNANLSHREKQLLKYKKRMLKRDKKHRKPLSTTSDATCELARSEVRPQKCDQRNSSETCQPMEQGEEEPHISVRRRSGLIEMISTGTQTQITCCQQCGSEKALVCLRCSNNNGDTIDCAPTDMDDMYNSSSSLNSSDIIQSPRNKAEILLQAIQRTPKAAKHKNQMSRCAPLCTASHVQNNNHLGAGAGAGTAPGMGCQVCKRQKTQHDFNAHTEEVAEGMGVQECSEGEEDDCVAKDLEDGKALTPSLAGSIQSHDMEEESFLTSTKLTPQIDRCTLSRKSTPVLSTEPGHSANGNTSEESAFSLDFEPMTCCGFKTPTNGQQPQANKQQQSFQQKQCSKPNLLKISCSYLPGAGGDGPTVYRNNSLLTPPTLDVPASLQHSLLGRKALPKVNLTPIFCNPAAIITSSLSSPIPINYAASSTDQGAFSFDSSLTGRTTLIPPHTSASAGATIDCNIPVQKSYSAPTLPNSPSLSPRFAKQAAIYKRRSRHLSDRSDRSSLGSDEQFSDEELEAGGIYSPATSPMKTRSRISAMFGRLPLLGNLEESLLQKRLVPKVQVMGFKVLLGASGGFCPTQLTIPAAAYFYELRGETLSTPYVCDIRLPRKGYSIPRVGTVQATLLNPMGTVVRMFVIPYDMRDMPPLHQTFIRQRILAEASTNEVVATASSNNIHTNGSVESSTKGNAAFSNGFSGDKQHSHDNNSGSISSSSSGTGTSSSSGSNKYRLSPNGGLHGESCLGHFISAEHMKRLRYSIHLRFQTSRSGRLSLHTDIRLLISRRTDCDTAAAHAKGVLEAPNDLVTDTVMPSNPKYSARQESTNSSKI